MEERGLVDATRVMVAATQLCFAQEGKQFIVDTLNDLEHEFSCNDNGIDLVVDDHIVKGQDPEVLAHNEQLMVDQIKDRLKWVPETQLAAALTGHFLAEASEADVCAAAILYFSQNTKVDVQQFVDKAVKASKNVTKDDNYYDLAEVVYEHDKEYYAGLLADEESGIEDKDDALEVAEEKLARIIDVFKLLHVKVGI
jgi:hypothetical protein